MPVNYTATSEVFDRASGDMSLLLTPVFYLIGISIVFGIASSVLMRSGIFGKEIVVSEQTMMDEQGELEPVDEQYELEPVE